MRIKTHCKRGHAFTEANTYVKTDGTRTCRECARRNGTAWYRAHPDKNRKRSREHYREHPNIHHDRHIKLKVLILTHYSPNGVLGCSWPDCTVCDLDVLTLDHVNDDGAQHRQTVGSGSATYAFLKRHNLPAGFQTLCMNHQWKKEMIRRRSKHGFEAYMSGGEDVG